MDENVEPQTVTPVVETEVVPTPISEVSAPQPISEPVIETPEPEVVLPYPTEGEPAQIDAATKETEPSIVREITPNSVTITEVMPEVSRTVLDTNQNRSFLASLLPKLREKLMGRTEKRLAKILELARTKSTIQ